MVIKALDTTRMVVIYLFLVSFIICASTVAKSEDPDQLVGKTATAPLILAQVSKDGKTGFINPSGSYVIPLSLDDACDFNEGLAPFFVCEKKGYGYGETDEGKWGYIDVTGKVVIKPKYRNAHSFSEGLAAVEIIGKGFGFIDKTDKMVINPLFDGARDFHENIAVVELNRRYGYISKEGNFIAKPIFERANDFHEGFANVVYENENERGLYRYVSGYLNSTGGWAINPILDDVCSDFSGGYATVAKFGIDEEHYGTHGILDKNMKYTPVKCDHSEMGLICFSEGLCSITINGEQGFIDTSGKLVIRSLGKWSWGWSFSEGLSDVSVNDKYGFINRQGQVVIAPAYDECGSFYCGLAAVCINKKWGFIDKTGKIVIKPIYGWVGDFHLAN